MGKISHTCHMDTEMSLDNAQIPHGFLHEFCHCGQICYTGRNETVCHHQNSQPQTERVHLDLRIVLKSRKLSKLYWDRFYDKENAS